MELDEARLEELEQRLGHRFTDRPLAHRALTHRSLAHDLGSDEHYERLEFLGDALLGLVTAEWLFRGRAGVPEGVLTRSKGYLVSAPVLAAYADELGLGELLQLSTGEERTGGRSKPSLLADCLEAVFGAVFLDGGYEAARAVVVRYLEQADLEDETLALRDAKTRLQERLQAAGKALPEYRLVDESGPDHAKHFSVECRVEGEVAGRGSGPSKKQAEQEAASRALELLERP